MTPEQGQELIQQVQALQEYLHGIGSVVIGAGLCLVSYVSYRVARSVWGG